VLQSVHCAPEKTLQLAKVDGMTLQLPEAKKNPGLHVTHEFPSTEYEAHPVLMVVWTQVVV
jgi:hypothetical protein